MVNTKYLEIDIMWPGISTFKFIYLQNLAWWTQMGTDTVPEDSFYGMVERYVTTLSVITQLMLSAGFLDVEATKAGQAETTGVYKTVIT